MQSCPCLVLGSGKCILDIHQCINLHKFFCILSFNRPEKFNGLLRRLELLKAHRLASSDLKPAMQLLEIFSANILRVVGCELRLDKRQIIGMLVANGSCKPVSLSNYESGRSSCWVALDVYMENTIDGKQLPIKSAIDVLAGKILKSNEFISF